MIADKIIKTGKVNWRSLEWLQGDLKEMTKTDFGKLKQSLIQNSFIQPFNVWDNGKLWILDGHHRKKAMEVLEIEGHKIPDQLSANFIDVKDMRQAKKLVLVYSSIYAKPTEESLYQFINEADLSFDELKAEIDIPSINLDKFERGWMTEEEEAPEAQMDKAAELQKKWGTGLGQLWQIGEHKLLCSDCTVKENVERLMGGEKAAVCWTDPPYNVAYGNNKNPIWGTRWNGVNGGAIVGDNQTMEEWVEFCERVATSVDIATDGFIYVCHAPGPDGRIMAGILDHNFHWSSTIIWKKDRLIPGRAKYQKIYEPMWFGWNSDTGNGFSSDRTLVDVWEVTRPSVNEDHPTMKPIELIKYALSHVDGELVFDGFLGSGTTMVACERLKRKCRAMEIEPKYVAVSLQRLADMGLEPKLVKT